jgi:hypothetical protein
MTENQIELPTNKLLEAHEEIVVAIAKQIEKVSSGGDLEDSCDIILINSGMMWMSIST